MRIYLTYPKKWSRHKQIYYYNLTFTKLVQTSNLLFLPIDTLLLKERIKANNFQLIRQPFSYFIESVTTHDTFHFHHYSLAFHPFQKNVSQKHDCLSYLQTTSKLFGFDFETQIRINVFD
jgi:hypothetical protein